VQPGQVGGGQVDLPGAGVVVDLGCGGGATLMRLGKQHPAAQVIGIDLSDPALADAQQPAVPGGRLGGGPGRRDLTVLRHRVAGVFGTVPPADAPYGLSRS
jgi:tRNA G46 methylase TrmB